MPDDRDDSSQHNQWSEEDAGPGHGDEPRGKQGDTPRGPEDRDQPGPREEQPGGTGPGAPETAGSEQGGYSGAPGQSSGGGGPRQQHPPGEGQQPPPSRETGGKSRSNPVLYIVIGGCLVLLLGCGGLAAWFSFEFGSVIREGVSGARQIAGVQQTSVQQAEQQADQTITLKQIVDDPSSAKGKWVEVEGRLVSPNLVSGSGGQSGPGGRSGQLFTTREYAESPELTMKETVMLTRSGGSGVGYAAGTDLRVLGKVVVMDLGKAMEDIASESERKRLEETGMNRMVMLVAKRVEELDKNGGAASSGNGGNGGTAEEDGSASSGGDGGKADGNSG